MAELVEASERGDVNDVRRLLEEHVDPDFRSSNGGTALMFASLYGKREVVEILLNAGANIDLQNRHGWTALILASQTGYREVVELLLNSGANIDQQDNYGMTALMYVSMYGKRELVELLLNAGANIDFQDSDGRTALMLASQYGKRGVVELLETYKFTPIDPDRENADHFTNLMIVARHFPAYLLHHLLRQNPNLNQQDKYGNTAIFYTIESGDYWKVKALLDAKVDVNRKNRQGYTAIDYGINSDNDRIQRLFIKPFIFLHMRNSNVPNDILRLIEEYL